MSAPKLNPPLARDLVAVMMLALVIWIGWRAHQTDGTLSEQIDCQARWNTAYANTSTKRQAWALEDRAALQVLVGTLARTPSGQSAEKSLQRYLDTVQANEDQRRENPLPENRCPPLKKKG